MSEGGRRSSVAIAAIFLGGTLPWGGALAQANGDPGSVLLGVARAQTHAAEKGKEKAAPPSEPSSTDASTPGPAEDGTQSVANAAHRD